MKNLRCRIFGHKYVHRKHGEEAFVAARMNFAPSKALFTFKFRYCWNCHRYILDPLTIGQVSILAEGEKV